MSSDLIPILIDAILILVSSGIFAFAGYRAFAIRRALVGGVYRKRSLWTGVFAMLLIPFAVLLIPLLNLYSLSQWVIALLLGYYALVSIVGFLVLDSTIVVARELDFFHRDSLCWGRVRGVTWAVMFIVTFFFFVIGFFIDFGPILGAVLPIAWPAPLGYYAAVLAVSSRRCQDKTIKSYAKWIGVFAVALVIDLALPPSALIPELIFTLIAAYLFYRTTESLSQKSKIEKEIA